MNWTEKEVNILEIKNILQENVVEVWSPDGWVGVTKFVDKGEWDEYILRTENGLVVRCNENHLFKTSTGWLSVKEIMLLQNKYPYLDEICYYTEEGLVRGKIERSAYKIPIVDIQVDNENHRYYTNGVESHNTGVGKTIKMCHMAGYNLMCGYNVLYITLEMAEEEISRRIDANLLDIPIAELKFISKTIYDKKMDKLRETVKGKLVVKEYPTSCAGANNFRYLLNELKLKQNFKPDIVYVDYINLCASSRMKMGASINSYTYIKAIAEELRGLAVEYDFPLQTATQVNRTGFTDSDFGLEHTSESFGLPATADFMIALISTEELEHLGQLMVKQLGKNRYAPSDVHKRFVIGIDKVKMRLHNCENAASENLVDDTVVFDKSSFGEQVSISGSKFDKKLFDSFLT